MKKTIVACTLFLSVLSSMAFAKDGGSRVFERNEIRVTEALAAQGNAKNDYKNTAKSYIDTNSKDS